MTAGDLAAGDLILIHGRERRVVEVAERGVSLIQLRNGVVGGGWRGRHRGQQVWRRTTVADGVRTTFYTWQDLRHAGAVRVGQP